MGEGVVRIHKIVGECIVGVEITVKGLACK